MMLDIKFIEDIYLPSILRHKGINYFPYLLYHFMRGKKNESSTYKVIRLWGKSSSRRTAGGTEKNATFK